MKLVQQCCVVDKTDVGIGLLVCIMTTTLPFLHFLSVLFGTVTPMFLCISKCTHIHMPCLTYCSSSTMHEVGYLHVYVPSLHALMCHIVLVSWNYACGYTNQSTNQSTQSAIMPVAMVCVVHRVHLHAYTNQRTKVFVKGTILCCLSISMTLWLWVLRQVPAISTSCINKKHRRAHLFLLSA